MLKKDLIIIFVISLLLINKNIFAQENPLKKAVEDLKNVPIEDSLLEKIDAYKKVVDLALAEAEDLKVKLLNLDKLTDKDLELQTLFLKELNNAINYYEKEKEDFLKLEGIDLDSLKKIAENFKQWREENYLPLNNKITDFILLKQQFKALEITKNRYQKIESDTKKFFSKNKNQKILNQINNLLENSRYNIKKAEEYFQKAENLFKEKYLLKNEDIKNTTSLEKELKNINPELKILNTSSSIISSSTIIEEKNEEVKDLIYLSFDKIKEVYGYFLKISKILKDF